jgi:hypothetical protein
MDITDLPSTLPLQYAAQSVLHSGVWHISLVRLNFVKPLPYLKRNQIEIKRISKYKLHGVFHELL